MQFSTSIPALAIALLTSISMAACGEKDPGGLIETATVSGFVKSAGGAFIEGASVKVGSASTTTGANGRFELRDLPPGSATIITSAPRFEARSESVSLIAGTNAHDVVLTQQTVFAHQNVLAYLPAEKAVYKAAIVFLPGAGNDSRGLVSGTASGCSIWCSPSVMAEVRSRALALAGGDVALIGTTALTDQSASYEALILALTDLGSQSLHPELATIPIFFVGHSAGGCTAYGFSRVYGGRVAGFMTMKDLCHNTGAPAAAITVPGYFLIGGSDTPARKENITSVFEAGRAAGAPWALSTDALAHEPIADIDLLFDWIDAVLTARLPASAGVPLRPITEANGWLGNRSNGAIATYSCYSSTPFGASWLPSQETALNWQRLAGGSAVVSECPAATATVSGVVKASTGAVIQGASVKVGNATTTSGADGRFELQNLPVGSTTITTTAPRYETRSEPVFLNVGTNVRDFVLTLKTIYTYQTLLAYLPPDKAVYKAAIVFLPGLTNPATGQPLDSRQLVSGEPAQCSIWCLQSERTEIRTRALQLAGGDVALIGAQTLVDGPPSWDLLIQALGDFAAQSLHPELANIPILFVGHSGGGCTSYGFSRFHGARVAGFITMKGGCHFPGPPQEAASVPGYFLIGKFDEPHRLANITGVFEQGRTIGAPWAVSIDDLGHNPMADINQMIDWMDAVLTARLPAIEGGPLRPMIETTGWLGNRTTGEIATYACYSGNRSLASWLPSQKTALHWQQTAKGTSVVTTC